MVGACDVKLHNKVSRGGLLLIVCCLLDGMGWADGHGVTERPEWVQCIACIVRVWTTVFSGFFVLWSAVNRWSIQYKIPRTQYSVFP